MTENETAVRSAGKNKIDKKVNKQTLLIHSGIKKKISMPDHNTNIYKQSLKVWRRRSLSSLMVTGIRISSTVKSNKNCAAQRRGEELTTVELILFLLLAV